MDITYSEDQEILRKSVRDFLVRECPSRLVKDMMNDEKGHDPGLWSKMAELGWLGMVIPEEYGGGGGSFLDLVLLLEETGYACLPGPFFSTSLLGAMPIMEAATSEQKRAFLPRIAEGQLVVTMALTEPSADYEPGSIMVRATAEGDNFVIDGTKLFVADALAADCLVCVSTTRDPESGIDGTTLFLVDASAPGITLTALKTLAEDKQCEINFDGVLIPKTAVLGEVGRGQDVVKRTVQRAAVGKCAEMTGAAQRILEMTVAYAKERIQFGRRIGSFQAVQHHCANMLVDVEASRFITYQAAWKLAGGYSCARDVAIAKSWVGDACRRVYSSGHQVHGAIGFTWDHDLHLYTRRIRTAEVQFGDADFHREAISRELAL